MLPHLTVLIAQSPFAFFVPQKGMWVLGVIVYCTLICGSLIAGLGQESTGKKAKYWQEINKIKAEYWQEKGREMKAGKNAEYWRQKRLEIDRTDC